MKTRRLNNNDATGAMPLSTIQRDHRWIQIPEPVSLADLTSTSQKRIFAIVSRAIVADGVSTRHILIFDNHPDTMRLMSECDLDFDKPDPWSAPGRWTSVFCGFIVIAILAGAIFWPLL